MEWNSNTNCLQKLKGSLGTRVFISPLLGTTLSLCCYIPGQTSPSEHHLDTPSFRHVTDYFEIFFCLLIPNITDDNSCEK